GDPDPPPHSGDAAQGRSDPGVPGADPGAASLAGAKGERDLEAARAGGLRADARAPLRGYRDTRADRALLRLSDSRARSLSLEPVADPEVRQSQARPQPSPAAVRSRPREADLCDSAPYAREEPRL